MNPEKYAEHTALNHSILWRKPYSYEKPLYETKPLCHKQVNELAQSGISWRTRNNMIQTTSSNFKSNPSHIRKTISLPRATKLLQSNKNQSLQTKNLKQSLTINADVLQRSAKLVEGMSKLKEMKLLSNKELQKVRYPGVIRHQHVHNDYHEKTTNPGFSRNVAGKHFTR